ncbi:MAG: dihydroneopterin aldolase family protein [Halolamina sp.]
MDDSTTTDATDRDAACFEAGIKFGSLYHQFAGTPVSPASADSLARAMEDAIENQPACERVDVEVREDRLREAISESAADYVEFTGRFANVEIAIEHEGVAVLARMALEDGYPRMRIDSVRETGGSVEDEGSR